MRRAVYDARKRAVFHTIVNHPAIECTNQKSHRAYLTEHGCAPCASRWLQSLTFWEYSSEDYLLKTEMRVDDNVEWYKEIVRDFWSADSPDWHGYTIEVFGYRLMDVNEPKNYPYLRIEDRLNPRSIIPLVRVRLCHEFNQVPAFLELRYYGFNIESAIRLTNSRNSISQQDIDCLVRARNRLLGHVDLSALLPVKRGRPKGKGCFASNESFLVALEAILKDADPALSVAKGLHLLSRHELWQGKKLSLKECQEKRKTLRNWLTRCNLTWDDAKNQYCSSSADEQ